MSKKIKGGFGTEIGVFVGFFMLLLFLVFLYIIYLIYKKLGLLKSLILLGVLSIFGYIIYTKLKKDMESYNNNILQQNTSL
jgi:hypothetical protein